MMNWLMVGVGLLILGVVLIGVGVNKARRASVDTPPPMIQTGYLLTVFGMFAIIAQYLSIGDTMLIFVVLTGTVVLLDRLVLRKRRVDGQCEAGWVTFSREFFPVLAIVFVIRGFIVEPFQIPSSSMRPGLIPGDFILVNKFSYGLRMPWSNHVLIPIGVPQRGDVMVFNYPNKPSVNYIKRVIGLPGDTVQYINKQLVVNGTPVLRQDRDTVYRYTSDDDKPATTEVLRETYGGKAYAILTEKEYPAFWLASVQEFPDRNYCVYSDDSFTCTVPEGKYFVLGDNRDHSGDSRYWGFVADKYVVGKAFFIWLNFAAFSRAGQVIQ